MGIRKQIKVFVCISVFFSIVTAVNVFAAVPATINGTNVNIRSGASMTAGVVTKLNNGAQITIIADMGEFYKISVKGANGELYVAKQFAKAPSAVGVVLDTNVNVRKASSTSSQAIGKANTGELFAVTGVEGDWLAISYNGKAGYIRNDFIKCDNPPKAAKPAEKEAPKEAPKAAPEQAAPPKNEVSLSVNNLSIGVAEPDPIPMSSIEVHSVTAPSAIETPAIFNTAEAEQTRPPLTNADIINNTEDAADSDSSDDLQDLDLQQPEGIIDDESYVDPVQVNMYTMVIARTGLNFRTAPSMDAPVHEIIPYESVIDVTETDPEWVKINYNGKEGYVKSEYILVYSGDKPATAQFQHSPQSVNQTRAQEIISYAERFLGTPYKYGGSTLGKGVDCSGFVSAVMKNFGISLPRSSADMARSAGTPVQKSDLQMGDLVFFSPRGSTVSHVGIYISNGKFIHSTDSKGKGVCYGSLNDDYRVRAYDSAKRVIR